MDERLRQLLHKAIDENAELIDELEGCNGFVELHVNERMQRVELRVVTSRRGKPTPN